MEFKNGFIKILKIEDCEEYTLKNLHQHDYFEIIWFTELTHPDTIQIDFHCYPIEDNQFYFINAQQLHRIDRSGKKGIVIAFSKLFFYTVIGSSVETKAYFSLNAIINKEKNKVSKMLIELIMMEYANECRPAQIQNYLSAVFNDFGPVVKRSCCCQHKVRVAELMDYMEDNFIEHKDAKFYVDYLGMTEKAINEMTKHIMGKTIKELLQDRLILEIEREIIFNQLSLKEIAYKLQFNDYAYFCRFFKQQTNLTPNEFRDQNLESIAG